MIVASPLAVAAMLTLAGARPVLAQEYPSGAMLSVEIVGAAPLPGLGIDRRLLPYPVQSAGASALRDDAGASLGDFMVRRLNGVNVNEVSGNPYQNDISYRGFRASSVLGSAQGLSVYLDGVRVNEPFGDVINWDMIPEAAIGSLLLVPGANPLFGLNTLGGALALTSKSGRSHPGLEVDVSTSDQGRRRASLAWGLRGGNGWHSFLGATVFDDRGWRGHSPSRVGNVLFKAGRDGAATDWHVTVQAGRSRLSGNGLLPDGLYQQDRRAAYTHPDQTRNHLRQAALNIRHRFDERTELSAIVYARTSGRDTVNGDISEAYADYAEDCSDGFGGACHLTRAQGAALHPGVLNTTGTRQRSGGASVNLSAQRGAHHVDAGIALDRSRIGFAQFEQLAFVGAAREIAADPGQANDAASSVSGDARALGLYAADTWTLVRGTSITASARFNHARVANTLTSERGMQAPERFIYRRLNPALGVAHEAAPGLTVYANLAQGNRVPTVIELGCADPAQPCRLPVGLQSDPYLKQVVSRTAEAGARWDISGAGASASFYRTGNRDDILFFSAMQGHLGYFANVERTRHQGADLDIHRAVGALVMRAGYSYLQAVYDADGELFMGGRSVRVGRGTRIAGLPRHTLKLGVDWQVRSALVLGVDAQALSNLPTQGNEDGALAGDWSVGGHAVLNMHAGWKAAPGWELSVRVNNLFDRRFETYGAIAADLFPGGTLAAPHEGRGAAGPARFVAPGAPRALFASLRHRF